MKIVVIGATGTIGAALADALAADHEVVRASRRGAVRVDLADPASIKTLFATVDNIDGVIAVAGSGRLTELTDPSDDNYFVGPDSKYLGQIHLVRHAARCLNSGGFVTLTSGVVPPTESGLSFAAAVNTGLDGFVPAAASEMPRGIRVNSVSPGWISETLESMGRDGAAGTPVSEVVRAYVELVDGTTNGRVIRPDHLPEH
ncbi:short chain dehydrogenase [Nocardia terpenica]|uniref:Short-chain dehydrogenase n=1 Tax=Nocardia terpenica TaxID=455432 RepID=A0A164NF45_9NOCA|nr:short chain dehydrogenase [Nocardia terpenica]KZM74294.1 short-chain dehydrogenase [Nocardia terpenica]NQE93137.1 short chain dehydrogenase [Nocardia terpenica]